MFGRGWPRRAVALMACGEENCKNTKGYALYSLTPEEVKTVEQGAR
jgi:hypothetical protein